jgi:Mg2+ and Co2+ transporter CorA
MTSLLDIPNPDEKIKTILNKAIKSKQSELDLITKELNNLKEQEKSGVYYYPIDTNNTSSSIQFVVGSILSIIGDILRGFQAAVEQIKDKVDEVETNQRGGNVDPNHHHSSANIKKQANNLLKIIGGANDKINEQIKSIPSTSSNVSTASSTLSNLEEDGKEVAGEVASKIKDLGEIGLKIGVRWYGHLLSKLINYGMDTIGEDDILNTPLDKLTPELNKKIILLASVLKEMSTNPATKEAVKEIAEAVAITMIEVLKEIEPQVDKVIEQSTEMSENVVEKMVTGVVGTGLAVAQAFISEIPFFGGIINLILAIGKGFNTLMITFRVFMDRSSPMVITSAHTIKNTEDKVIQGKNRIMSAVDNAATTIQSASKSNQQNGGSNSNSNSEHINTSLRSIHHKIQSGGKRLNRTLKLFHNTLPKLKFSHASKTHKMNMKMNTNKHKFSKTKKSQHTGGKWNTKKTRKHSA